MGDDTDRMAALARNVERATSRAQLEAAKEALAEAVLAHADGSGYVLVGPSAHTWRRDPDTGQPATPVSEAEHRAVRELLGRDTLDTHEPEWVTSPGGRPEVHSTVVLTTDHTDTAGDAGQMTDDQYEAWYQDRFETHEYDYGAARLDREAPDDGR